MRHSAVLVVSLTVMIQVLLMAATCVTEGADKEQLDEVAIFRKDFEAAKTGADTGRLCRKYFLAIGRESLDETRWDSNVTLALQAAFERDAVVKPWLSTDKDQQVVRRILKAEDAQRFFGFFEGRTKIPVPKWWEGQKEFPVDLASLCPDGPRSYYQVFRNAGKLVGGPAPGGELVVPTDYSIQSVGDTIEVHYYNFKTKLALQIEPSKSKVADGTRLLVRFGETRSVAALWSATGTNISLLCCETRTGKLLWQQTVWGQVWSGGLGGKVEAKLDLYMVHDRAVVFGSGTFSSFAESFHLKDGTVDFRFSTDYWDAWPVHVSPETIAPKKSEQIP